MSVTYMGGMKGSEDTFKLDYKYYFKVLHKYNHDLKFVLKFNKDIWNIYRCFVINESLI